MEAKSKFKQTEIGEIPEDWDVKALDEITSKITKGTTPTTLKKQFVNKGINFIKIESLTESGQFISSKFAHIDDETNQLLKRSIIEENDILFSIAGVIGRAAIATKEILPANTNQAIAIVRPVVSIINPIFLRYAVSNKSFIYNAHANIVQTAQPNLSLGLLSKGKIGIPSLNEQKDIAKILLDLDKKIENIQMQIDHLDKIGKLLFRENILNLETYSESSLDKIANYLNGLALQKYPPKGDNDLHVIKIRELKQGITDVTDMANSNLPKEYIIENGDILFSWSGSLKVVIWCNGKGALNQHLFKVTSDKYPKWFYYYWTLHHLGQFKRIAADKATTMGHIKRKHLTEAIVKIPNKQHLEELGKLFTPIIDKQIISMIEIKNLENIRDSLLPKLITGKIRVMTDA